MIIATAVLSQTTPAAVEFALLQSWLASGSALQLSLHEIERQQQARGHEVQRLLLSALEHLGNGRRCLMEAGYDEWNELLVHVEAEVRAEVDELQKGLDADAAR